MYEFGTFVAFWSNFELMVEVGIWLHSGTTAKENCKSINVLKAGRKKERLKKLLDEIGNVDAGNALVEVFDVADRNGWIHGHILNPNGDFSRLTRLRVEVKGPSFYVTNTVVRTDSFDPFYEAYASFEQKSGITKAQCDEYIRLVQTA
ncbi:hypothetical protein EV670_1174 [Rivibacter subsaxonicus]|uniref:Uncharacterized protein n=2 Tax=Rivibacter subsaxonicus TaxID=457575 RepID=A0A4Q7W1L5_9BURK|nr:hypothetical protein EV670_1174 [Rivibacter subsaxonicus]